jgi:tetratricopeptide (TPR) repeat protein
MKLKNTILKSVLILSITLSVATGASAGRGAFAGDSVGARASILGEAFVALADDANALRWNPAGLTQLLQPELTSSHIGFFSLGGYVDYTENSSAINEDFIGLAWPNHIATFGISFLNLGTPGMLHADESGAVMNTKISYAERSLTLSVGKLFKLKSLSLSAGWNLNRFSLSGQSDDSGFGMDAGILLETPGILPEFGLMLRGLFLETTLGDAGPTIPAKTDFAMAFSPLRFLKLVGGLSKTSGDSILQYSTGLELDFHWLSPLSLSFLAGYKVLGKLENGTFDSQANGTAVGGSIRISRYKLDYAYEQHSIIEDTHRVTFGFWQHSPVSFHLNKGRAAFEQLDDTGAIDELEETIYLSPRKAEAYHLMALTYERMRQKDEAIRLLRKVQSLNRDYFQENQLGRLMADIREQD